MKTPAVLIAVASMALAAAADVLSCYVGAGPAPSTGSRAESAAQTIFLGRSSSKAQVDFELRSLTEMESPGTGIDMTFVPGYLLFFR